ncbi:tetratricopeptide repeat protein [Croceicoccus sp. BE223]|uniref:tetratricopeptide repeat protein n=1 Tax=Croceicoccus sp. BE223 TaxID=2817716 RepID=UPI002855CA78|nr:tetratricopeptide repeat protein [Croceicoccus sp. BE223]MDR7101329.1 cytochrome c-type biogenesis protein CcmH [Croceicoccus sp. BE223]
MGWFVVIGLAAVAFAIMAFAIRLPRGGREFAAAAFMLGLAGYALQGSPWEAGSPTEPRETEEQGQAAMIEARKAMGNQYGAGVSDLITADAFMRAGQFGAAATLLRGATHRNPNDPDVWVALGNALVAHSSGIITPAATFAFDRAAAIAPDHPGPPFFKGLALAQSGEFEEGRAIWQGLLDRPGDPQEPWRQDLVIRLQRLDQIIAMTRGAAPGPNSGANPGPNLGAAMPSGPVPVEQDAPAASPVASPSASASPETSSPTTDRAVP